MERYLGIDLGGTKIACGLFDEKANLLKQTTIPTPQSGREEFLNVLFQATGSLIGQKGSSPCRIGIGIPGTADFEKGVVINTPNIPFLNGFALGQAAAAHFKLPVLLDNDANLAALAEFHLGAGAGCANMVYATVSTGIGGGIIINGDIFRGDYGLAGEIGHCIAESGEGFLCPCGNQGCYESICGGVYIDGWVRKEDDQNSMLGKIALERKVTGKDLSDAISAGDPLALRLFERTCSHLGLLFYNLYQVLNIKTYVIGGGLTKIGTPLFSSIEKHFGLLNQKSTLPVSFLPAALGTDAGVIGAGLLAIKR